MLINIARELLLRPSPTPRGWNASRSTRVVLAALTLGTLTLGTNLITPLFPYLQDRLDLDNSAVTIAYAAYVLPVVLGLPMVGHWSEYMGRRVVLVAGLTFSVSATVALLTATALPGLVLARALQGAAVAFATGAAAAALRDLLPGRAALCTRITLLANLGGCAIGPVAGGFLARLGDPVKVPFTAYLMTLPVLVVLLMALRPNPPVLAASPRGLLHTLRPPRPTVPARARHIFVLASVTGFLSFAVFGFMLSVAPTVYTAVLGDSQLLSALPAALTLGSSACAQLLHVRGRHTAALGLLIMGVGLTLLVTAAAQGLAWLLLCGAAVTGLGQGVAFRTVFSLLSADLPVNTAARTISLMYVITYLGSALPVLGLGIALDDLGTEAAVRAFLLGAAVAAGALAVSCLGYTPPDTGPHLRGLRAGSDP